MILERLGMTTEKKTKGGDREKPKDGDGDGDGDDQRGWGKYGDGEKTKDGDGDGDGDGEKLKTGERRKISKFCFKKMLENLLRTTICLN